MDVADPQYLLHTLRRRWLGGGAIYNNERCDMMTIDELASKLERINVLSDLLTDLLVGNPQAQTLAEIIMETSLLPGV
jgi:hypothetical protein